MSFPGFGLSFWYDILSGARMTRGQAGIDGFRNYLNNGTNQTVRFYVASTSGWGHQTSSALLIRRLCAANPPGFAYTGTIEAYIDATLLPNPNLYNDTLAKMIKLLGFVANGNGPYQLNNATVRFFPYPANPPAPAVNLGFTGGADDDKHYAAQLNTAYFLRLQPYRWKTALTGKIAEEVQFVSTKWPYVNLDNQYVLGYHMFEERAYYQPIAVPNWVQYANNQQAMILRWLTDPARLARFDFCPIYSIRRPATCELGTAGQALIETLAGVLAAEQLPNGKPAVVVNLDVYEPPTNDPTNGFEVVEGVLTNQTPWLFDAPDVALNTPAPHPAARRAAFAALNATTRFDYFIYNPNVQMNLTALQNKITQWLVRGNNRVLYIQLGHSAARVGPDLFEYAYSKATLPGVFEGQNTANLALNIGLPYFHVNRPMARGTEQYPSDILSLYDVPPVAREIQTVADQIVADLASWPLNPPNPLTRIANFIQTYRAEDPNTGKFHKYFAGMRAFYTEPTNDKFNVSVCFLNYLINGKVAAQQQLAMDVEAGAGGDTLDAIYQAFSTAAAGGGPVIFKEQLNQSAQIATFIASVESKFGQQFATTKTKVVKDGTGNLTKVTVTGDTALFGVDGVVGVAADFTAPDGVVILTCRYTGKVAWRPDGLPWIGFANPYVEFTVADADLLVAGKLGGTLIGPDIDFYAILPPSNGRMLFGGNFLNPPSIDKFFQLVGGISLVASLPAPLNIIAQLELMHVEFAVDGKSIDFFAFLLTWKDPGGKGWQLLPNVTLNNIDILITVSDPANAASLRANLSGQFTIGKGPKAGVIQVGVTVPDLSFNAQLTQGEILMTDLLGMFLPGVTLNPPSQPSITEFAFNGVQKTGDYQLSCKLGFDWKIPTSSLALLELNDIGLLVNRSGGAVTGQLTGSVTLLPNDEQNALTLILTAEYLNATDGWEFSAVQASDTQRLSLIALVAKYTGGWTVPIEYGINGINFKTRPNKGTYTIGGKTAKPWTLPFIDPKDSPSISASMELSYDPAQTVNSGYSGNLSATIKWLNIAIDLGWVFGPSGPSYTLDWGHFHATVKQNSEKQWVATGQLKGVTLGGLIEDFVSFVTGSRFGLSAPWDLLNSISLDAFALTFNFTTKQVGFSVSLGPINLGFARLDSIDVSYQSGQTKAADNGVKVKISGSFPWNVGATATGDTSTLGPWDAAKPETTPAPPGNGNKYLDLRLLALGQHVTFKELTQSQTIQDAIKLMAEMPIPEPGQLPGVQFDAGSSWLIGTDMGILKLESDDGGDKAKALAGDNNGQALVQRDAALAALAEGDDTSSYFITLQIVFNDPYLYGLRIALEGEPAKIFKGLDFQIMYRQISSTVGVYQAQITLPDAMRNLSIGAYSVTLPVFGISIYTNGDFLIDIGFPWNQDFSRSFTFEGIIYPGIPVLGSAGFYFGKLSSATSTQVPTITNGTFNPVIVFGFGMQIGFGKSVHYGILSAGFSLTVFGIIEGVIAKFNPYQITDGSGASSQVQGSYYFWLRGTVGIIGKLYGTIDFAIIKADVNVEIKLMIQLTYESFVSISLSVLASVDVSVSVSIDLGLFSITIHFSFSMQLKETFTINNLGTPPWKIAGATNQNLLSAPADRRLRAARSVAAVMEFGELAATTVNWNNLLPATNKITLTGYVAPALTIARNEWNSAQSTTDQAPCYIASMFIDSVAPANVDATTSALKASGAAADTPFEILCKMVFRWVVAAIQSSPKTSVCVDSKDPNCVDNLIVTEAQLDTLLSDVLQSTDDNPTPIPPDAIDTFMSGQFKMTVQLPNNSKSSPNTTFFPIAPALQLNIPAVGSYPGYGYSFASYNSIDNTGLKELRDYFKQLSVQVSQEMKSAQPEMFSDGKPLSMASWIISDYFLLLARQMTQAAREALRDFQYPIKSGESPDKVLQFINTTGKLTGTPSEYTLYDLFVANQTQKLTVGSGLTIGVSYQTSSNDSFHSIAHVTFDDVFSADKLAYANAANTQILAASAVITYPKLPPYTVQAGDSLISIASHFSVALNDLLVNTTALTQSGLLAQTQTLVIPEVTYQALVSDTFTSIAGASSVYGGTFSAAALAALNAGMPILLSGAQVTYPAQGNYSVYTVQPQDCLGDVANYFKVSVTDLISKGGVLQAPPPPQTLPTPQPLLQAPLSWLLAPVSRLVVPKFQYATVANDNLQGVAARFGVTLDVLAAQPANRQVVNLFAANDKPNLDIPHLPQFQVAALLDEAQRSLALQHLSGMASRYYLHGLRLPTDGITPKANGMWVQKNDKTQQLTLPTIAGLYALTGQQFPLPTQNQASFTFTLDSSAGPAWLLFQDSQGKSTTQLKVSLTSTDLTRITSLTSYAQQTRLNVNLTQLGAGQMFESELASYPFTSSLIWQSASPVPLPYGTAPSGVPSLRLWNLPDSMVNLPDLTTRAINPRFSLKVARYDEATGATKKVAVNYYGWASVINFIVKRVPAVSGSPSTQESYEVVGASGNDIILLERLVAEAQNDSLFSKLILAYQPDQAGAATKGLQSDALGSITMGIAQVNLSTDTKPPGMLDTMGMEDVPALGLLNTSSAEFVRLLWEASITGGNGFYLYYYNAQGKTGLPDRIFNDKNEAQLSLVVIYSALNGNRMSSYMNAVAIDESIDAANSVVFALADPPAGTQIPSSSTASLADIAYQYYSDIGDLAQSNAGLTLKTGAPLVVKQGVFQAPLAGISLANVAKQFGVTVQAIQQANQGTLPDPLVFPVAILLPPITVSGGSGANTATLSAIAAFYGENLTALAADNSTVSGIFAINQQVVIPGGPRQRAATVLPGVEAVEASRPMPPAIPTDPGDPTFAEKFLENTFSLLNYQVVTNAYFKNSNLGLPAGPTTASADSSNQSKVRVPKTMTAGDTWTYKQALPYPKFAKPATQLDALLPDPGDTPYLGIGYLLQVAFDWQDYYGNTLVTTLSDPLAGDSGPSNQPPMLTGYTDPLVGLGRWPSVSAGWQVLPGILELMLSFDDSRYEGLLKAVATNSTTITVTFTEPLDPATATNTANYTLDGAANVQSATLNGQTVQLTLATALSTAKHSLSISGIKNQADTKTFDGQAQFSFPDDQSTLSSSIQQNAVNDLHTYKQLFYQLTDPNGISFMIQSSLLAGQDGQQGTIQMTAAQVKSLMAWLFTGTSSIYSFIQDRSTFGTSAPPPAQSPVDFPLDNSQLNQAQIFELSLSFVIARAGGTVLGDLETTPGIRQTTTPVAALMKASDNSNSTVSLAAFAQSFQDALSQPGSYLMKVATGVDRTQVSASSNGGVLWAVRLGLVDNQAISYSINNPGKPMLFAPQPISNQLQTRQVNIYDYTKGVGISKQVTRSLNFTGIDMDVWGRQFFGAVDDVLTPQFTSATQIVGQYKGKNYLQLILDQKKALAKIAKLWMIPVFADDTTADVTQVQEAFYQQMLSRLSNAYTTQAGIEFQATVNASVTDPAADQPPRLYGNVVQNKQSSNSHTSDTVTLTSPKLALSSGKAPLTFLLTAPEVVVDNTGEVVAYLDLDLSYNGINIEHQISSVPGISKDYVTSSWLNFVSIDKSWPLAEKLGAFQVPLILRSFPASPVMVGQKGSPTPYAGKNDLSKITEWTYAFTYSLPFHYPQDRIYCEVEFNIKASIMAEAGFEDAFAQLAEFITVYPDVSVDLQGILAGIDATTDPVKDKEQIDNAAIALDSFIKMVTDVTKAAGGSALMVHTPPRLMAGTPGLTYAFYLQECSVDLPETSGALLVSIIGKPPAGIGNPKVEIDPLKYQAIPYTDKDCEKKECNGVDRFCYVYQKIGSDPVTYLTAADGQMIPNRQVELPGMDILQRQDASSTIYIKRNEELVPGRKSADPFVYTTPEVQFSNPLYPMIDSSSTVCIPCIPNSGTPSTRSLADHLTALFTALLAKNTEPSLTFQVESTYEYALNNGLLPVSLPVFMQAPASVTIAGTGAGTLAQLVLDWSAAIALWFKTNQPNPNNGTLWFDLVIMSSLTAQPMPLLRLRELNLPIQYIQPPLATNP